MSAVTAYNVTVPVECRQPRVPGPGDMQELVIDIWWVLNFQSANHLNTTVMDGLQSGHRVISLAS